MGHGLGSVDLVLAQPAPPTWASLSPMGLDLEALLETGGSSAGMVGGWTTPDQQFSELLLSFVFFTMLLF